VVAIMTDLVLVAFLLLAAAVGALAIVTAGR
jgi:hypothetical protein